jgi:transcriptional regulator with XRE-family HTH domain
LNGGRGTVYEGFVEGTGDSGMEEKQFPMIDIGRTGQRLKELCYVRNVSPKELQKLLNLGSVQAVYNWFNGERLPAIDNLFAISRLLNVSIDDILVEMGEERAGGISIEFNPGHSRKRLLYYMDGLVNVYLQ